MSANTVDFQLNRSANTDRGPSKSIWGDCPVLDLIEDPSKGQYFFDDFNMVGGWATTNTTGQSMGQWASYGSTGALPTDSALEGGVLGLDSDAADESSTIASTVGAYRVTTTSTLALNQKLWFECRVALKSIAATKNDTFVGLADTLVTSGLLVNTKPITTTDDTLSTSCNLLGFHKKSSVGSDFSFVYQLAGGTAVYPTGLTTLATTVAGAAMVAQSAQTGFVKFGFVFDPGVTPQLISSASTGQTAGVLKQPLIKVFVNGVPAAAFLTSTNVQGAAFPTGFMGLCFSVMQTASGANTSFIDWIRVAQLANL